MQQYAINKRLGAVREALQKACDNRNPIGKQFVFFITEEPHNGAVVGGTISGYTITDTEVCISFNPIPPIALTPAKGSQNEKAGVRDHHKPIELVYEDRLGWTLTTHHEVDTLKPGELYEKTQDFKGFLVIKEP